MKMSSKMTSRQFIFYKKIRPVISLVLYEKNKIFSLSKQEWGKVFTSNTEVRTNFDIEISSSRIMKFKERLNLTKINLN